MVFVAVCSGVGAIGIDIEYNGAIAGDFVSGWANGDRSSTYYDGCWGADRYSISDTWFFANDKKYILTPKFSE